MFTGVRWGRVVVAALLSEVMVIAVLFLVIGAFRFVVAPGLSAAEYDAFNDRASYWVAPFAAGVAAFLSALWAVRKLPSGFMANGIMVGAIAVLISLGFVFTAKPEDRFMYEVSYLLRLVGGYLAGFTAQRML